MSFDTTGRELSNECPCLWFLHVDTWCRTKALIILNRYGTFQTEKEVHTGDHNDIRIMEMQALNASATSWLFLLKLNVIVVVVNGIGHTVKKNAFSWLGTQLERWDKE